MYFYLCSSTAQRNNEVLSDVEVRVRTTRAVAGQSSGGIRNRVESDEEGSVSNLSIFARMTRNGSTFRRLESVIKSLDEGQVEATDDMLCIIGCGRKKNTLVIAMLSSAHI